MIGALDHIEVWDTEAWTSYATAQEEAFAQMDEKCSARADRTDEASPSVRCGFNPRGNASWRTFPGARRTHGLKPQRTRGCHPG